MTKQWPVGSGGMAARVREHDWAQTPLGPAAAWPGALRRAADITLGAPMASVLLWGPQYIVAAYNEGYRLVLGDKPEVLGRPVLDVWAEERALLEPQLARALEGETLLFRELPMSLSRGAALDNSWFDYGYGPVRDDSGAVAGLIVTILEVTDRVVAQRAQRDSEARQAFLLQLGDALRLLADPVEIIAMASEALGRHLGVGRCGYGEVDETGEWFIVERDWTDGAMPSFVGRHFFDSFGPELVARYRSGKSVLIDDALADARAAGHEDAFEAAGGVRAALGLPLIKKGRFVAGLFVQQLEPRHWTVQDEALALEVTERTWAAVERARAEAATGESEARLHVALASANLGTFVWHVAEDRTEEDAQARAHFGLPPDGTVSLAEALATTFHPDDGARYAAAVARAIDPAGPGTLHEEYRIRLPSGEERWMSTSAITTFEGAPPAAVRLTGALADVTERKRAESALQASEERQAFLLRLSDALRPLTDAGAVKEHASRLLGQHLRVDRAGYVDLYPNVEAADIQDEGWLAPGVPSAAGVYRTASFHGFADELVQGKTAIMENSLDDPRVPAGTWDSSWGLLDVRAAVSHALMKAGHLAASFYVHSIAPRRWSTDEIALIVEVGERTWEAVERARAEAALRESEARFTQFAKASSGGLWIRDAATLAMEYVSPAIGAIYGVSADAILGDIETWAAMIVPEDRDGALEHIKSARRGESVSHEFRIQRPSDQTFRWIRNTDFPLDQNGHVGRIGGIAEDVTEARLSVEHQAVLLAELQHRVRNIMAIIRSIVSRTADGADSVATYADLLSGRLLTLARVQALLTRAANATVSMTATVHEELSAQAAHAGQFDVHGPEIALSPKAAETMTLAIHELTTNALKYGALSAPDGLVLVRWEVVEKRGVPWLAFDWSETGAPPRPELSGPRRQGFGSELIEGRIPYELKGKGAVRIEPGGARCHLEFPLKEGASVLETGAPQPTTVFGGDIDMSGEADLSGWKILVVEDDFYLATDTARALSGAGAEVLGPYPTEAAAREQMAQVSPSAAVLDINLEGGRSFDLARELKGVGTPFIFVTGYDQEVIPDEFQAITRLQKPVTFKMIITALAEALKTAA